MRMIERYQQYNLGLMMGPVMEPIGGVIDHILSFDARFRFGHIH